MRRAKYLIPYLKPSYNFAVINDWALSRRAQIAALRRLELFQMLNEEAEEPTELW